MNVLLTGPTGHLGREIMELLLKKGYEVLALPKLEPSIVTICRNLEHIFKQKQFHIIIHAATCYGRKGEDNSLLTFTNVILPLQILEFAIKYKVPHFINIDTSLPRNMNFYSLSKKYFLDCLHMQLQNIKITNVILEAFYGPGQKSY